MSLHSDAQYQLSGTPPRTTTGASYRRSSLYSQYTPSHGASPLPPQPHQPQAHFYGAQDLDLTTTPQSGIKPGDRGLYFGFDRLPPDLGGSANKGERVILSGYEGGLQVYAVSKRGVELVSSLRGLRGGVYQAKILPWTVASNMSAQFPLVAVVVHGPVLPEKPADDAPNADATSRPTPSSSASPRAAYGQPESIAGRGIPPFQFYQTSVEVYSLKTNKLVDVLLQAPRVPISTEVSLTSPLFQPPPVSGSFAIKADAGTVAVCSGDTGECWIYRPLLEPHYGHVFACACKLWTTLQQRQRAEVAEEAADKPGSSASMTSRTSPQTPIFALGGHWIAYCPPNPSSHSSLQAHLPVPTMGRAPGVTSMAPPHLPGATAAVNMPMSDGMMNKIMRETTQELIQGMKWVGKQGMQAWNSYWSQPSEAHALEQTQQQQMTRSPPQQWASGRSPQLGPGQFPPTHGNMTSTSSAKNPGLVSIVDVDTLATGSSLHHVATFAAPLGCSFLSFSPSALSLFTASTKGDVQTVWDLLRLQHKLSSPLQATLAQNEDGGPQVRQVAQFSRMTVARIVDVTWSEPLGERLAMVTERGTVHMLDMPFSAFMWPPPRRRQVTQARGAEQAEAPNTAVSIAAGALGAAYSAAKPLVSRSRRGSSNTTSPSTGSTLRDSAAQGGRAIAATISHSLGKTGTAISQLRHTGENRVSLPAGGALPSAACVTWIKSRKSQALYSASGGVVRLFPCQVPKSATMPGKKMPRWNMYKDLKVPLLPNDITAPVIRQIVELGGPDEYLELSEADMDAGNTMTLKPPAQATTRGGIEATIPQAEIESSAPYQPFHTDRRVSLCEYTHANAESNSVVLANMSIDDKPTTSKKKRKENNAVAAGKDEAQGTDTSAWAFGQEIPSVKLDLGFASVVDDDEALPPSAMERVMEYGDTEQIVVTTRRRKGGRGDGGEDGFFEDDCEVLDFADQRV